MIIVYGFYFKHNTGDQLFIQAFRYLFPEFSFKFVDYLTVEDIKKSSAIWFGGGSFLYDAVKGEKEALQLLETKQIIYLGVGVEELHPLHQRLISKAKLIGVRNQKGYLKVKELNKESYLIPDLVYALSNLKHISRPIKKSILIIPNIEVIGKWNDINWKHAAWNYFKSEFSQSLDELKRAGHIINFAPMCQSAQLDDNAASAEIITQMHHRDYGNQLCSLPEDFIELTKLISQYELIISQRYHGCVLADICEVPYISIAHHDKLNSVNNGEIISYYEFSKSKLFNAINKVNNSEKSSIKLDCFRGIRNKILEAPGQIYG